MRHALGVVAILFVAFGCRVFAEVMDKEPTITQIWIYAGVGGLVAIAAWRWRWWIGLPYSVIWLWGIWAFRQEVGDPFVGPAILREAAVQAALKAKFSPTKLSGQPVKVSGVINYKFALVTP